MKIEVGKTYKFPWCLSCFQNDFRISSNVDNRIYLKYAKKTNNKTSMYEIWSHEDFKKSNFIIAKVVKIKDKRKNFSDYIKLNNYLYVDYDSVKFID